MAVSGNFLSYKKNAAHAVVSTLHPKEIREPTRMTKECVQIFGFKSSLSLLRKVDAGEFPKPDLVVSSMHSSASKKCYWRLSTIKKEYQVRFGKPLPEGV